MLTVYGIPNCNTVKKARDWLDAHKVVYNFHDFKKQGASRELVTHWLTQIDKEILINRSGLTWRGLNDEVKSAALQANIHADSGAVDLMCAKSSVIKRPILEQNGKIIALGFNETEYQKLLAK